MREVLLRRLSNLFWPSLFTALCLLAWELLVRACHVRSIVLPPPSEIASVLVARYDILLINLWPTLWLTVMGFLLSIIGGVAVAILITYSAFMRKGLYPVIIVWQIIPKIAIAPLFIVWFGAGTLSALLLSFLVAFFPMAINAATGLASVDGDIERMARVFLGSPWQVFWKVRLPAALPAIFAVMKISVTLAIIGVVVSEFVASQEGVGYLIKLAGGLLDTPLMLAAITVLSVSGLGLYAAISVLERWAIHWHPRG
jgi:NitT/TauT family transport system permease protein